MPFDRLRKEQERREQEAQAARFREQQLSLQRLQQQREIETTNKQERKVAKKYLKTSGVRNLLRELSYLTGKNFKITDTQGGPYVGYRVDWREFYEDCGFIIDFQSDGTIICGGIICGNSIIGCDERATLNEWQNNSLKLEQMLEAVCNQASGAAYERHIGPEGFSSD